MQEPDPPIPTRADVAGWSAQQRAEVARILDDLVERPLVGRLRRRRSLVLAVTAGGALMLFPWAAHLTRALPDNESVRAWRTAWVGFDVALALLLGTTAWLVWYRRALSVLALMMVHAVGGGIVAEIGALVVVWTVTAVGRLSVLSRESR